MARTRASAPSATSRSTSSLGGRFTATLWRYPGKGGWIFADVPDRLSPPVTHGWGRTPVTATVRGVSWATSVWRGKDGRTLLPLPKPVGAQAGMAGRTLAEGDRVTITLRFHAL